MDREDERALWAALGTRTFDVVVGQVCYTPLQAAVARRVFAGRTGRYVMTSTMEVYDPGTLPGPADPGRRVPVTEEYADPRWAPSPAAHPWWDPAEVERRLGPARAYAEGERQAEAVFLHEPASPFAAVRAAHADAPVPGRRARRRRLAVLL